ncbi:hypothetical protein NDU88_006533 [Pleurodeles waltl]|uniref:Uncharacterized protein n=1 Tax=Pleurodeles waltl TaxID=8319 RepID=A0AAV7LPF6_PLEWA|nr:hypothetical protein NDU88_006533 [Pleurodeles waltl]
MHGTRAFPFSVRASKARRLPGKRESAGACSARRATTRGARTSTKGRRSASTLGERFSESEKTRHTPAPAPQN